MHWQRVSVVASLVSGSQLSCSHNCYSALWTHCGGGRSLSVDLQIVSVQADKQINDEFKMNPVGWFLNSCSICMKKLTVLGLGWPYQDIHFLSWLADWLVSGPGMLSSCHHIPGSQVCSRWQALISPRLQTAECQETYADLITGHCTMGMQQNIPIKTLHKGIEKICHSNRDIALWECRKICQ